MSLYEVLKARKTGLSPDLYTLLRAQREMPERVITAEPPIYFKSDGTAISEYQISGDTVQSGTPTPDNPVEVLGVGDRTGNLFDISSEYNVNASMEFSTGKFPVSSGGNRYTYFFKVKPNTEYAISFSDVSDRLVAVGYNKIVNPLEHSDQSLIPSFYHRINSNEGLKNYTFTTTSDEIMVGIYYALNVVPDEIMLNEGSTILLYEPYGYKIPITLNSVTQNVYLDEPLYSGDYIKRNADGSGVVHRAQGKLVFDGTEDVTYNARNDTNRRWVVTIPTPNGTTTPENVICTHFRTVNATTKPLSEGGICMRSTGVDVVVGGAYADIGITAPSDSATIVNAVKAYLAEQYAAETPVTVYYQLATPTDTPITLPQLLTVKGNNELNINTTVTPEITLKGKIKQLPDSDMNALLSVMEEM